MALTKRQIDDVCLLNKGAQQCRYLGEDDYNGKSIYVCGRLAPEAAIIDEDAEDFIVRANKAGEDPNASGQPLSINCPGYLLLKAKKQGYDA
jgi:hypothetical protein